MKTTLSLIALVGCIGLSLAAPQLIPSDKIKLLQVSHANDEFESNLLRQLESESQAGKNVFVSGFSISSALAMLMAGGVNQTYNEIYNTLGYGKSQFSNSDVMQGYHALMDHLNHPTIETGNILSVANALAVQKNEPVLESFLNSITTYFGAQMFAEDFHLNSQKATDELNHWVSEKTHGKIPKLFEKLEPSTIMVLMNAIYFKGVWEHKFEAKDTKNEPFHLTREASEQVPTMMQRGKLNYGEFEDGELLEIPYQNKSLSMYILLPSQNTANTKQMSTLLTTHTLAQRIASIRTHDVIVHLPKFKFSESYSMKKTLQAMGIHAAFSGADFSNINGHRDLQVSEVIHKTFIDVNEEGSEAAAATGVVIVRTSSVHPPQLPIEFRVDRPFMFFIRDNEHQLNLFSGIINKPEYEH